ncbi:(2S)-3-sulfopropanediol dehydratase activating enzyme [Oleidesulfovibrio sp.]|uniref:(2S)-3-sulfopropanediol dehydratase activating enzyme n=1 Tax=Oleidesulfovibrio sp. TaxID=2909707 RepID=UPI003A8A47F6
MSSLQDKKTTGITFNIQKYSVHDGPGIRTVVFLKGCPLRCDWCSNPESQRKRIELAYNTGRCLTLTKCVRCVEVCTTGAITRAEDDTISIDRALCEGCTMFCAEACPAKSLITYGTQKTVDEVLNTVEQDSVFYARSGGGMTLSGGEPFAQPAFALAILREARRRRIHTAIETCGYAAWEDMAPALEFIKFAHYDIKSLNDEKHKRATGVSNKRIIENLERMVKEFPAIKVVVRTPVIPGFNDSEKDIRAIAQFTAKLGVEYQLLPYHRLGTQKYHFLGREVPMGDVKLSDEVMQQLTKIVEQYHS